MTKQNISKNIRVRVVTTSFQND